MLWARKKSWTTWDSLGQSRAKTWFFCQRRATRTNFQPRRTRRTDNVIHEWQAFLGRHHQPSKTYSRQNCSESHPPHSTQELPGQPIYDQFHREFYSDWWMHVRSLFCHSRQQHDSLQLLGCLLSCSRMIGVLVMMMIALIWFDVSFESQPLADNSFVVRLLGMSFNSRRSSESSFTLVSRPRESLAGFNHRSHQLASTHMIVIKQMFPVSFFVLPAE